MSNPHKLDKICSAIEIFNPTIVLLTETHLDPNPDELLSTHPIKRLRKLYPHLKKISWKKSDLTAVKESSQRQSNIGLFTFVPIKDQRDFETYLFSKFNKWRKERRKNNYLIRKSIQKNLHSNALNSKQNFERFSNTNYKSLNSTLHSHNLHSENLNSKKSWTKKKEEEIKPQKNQKTKQLETLYCSYLIY